MSAVCTCSNPIIKDSESGEKYCSKCTYLWIPKYESHIPGSLIAGKTDEEIKQQFGVAPSVFDKNKSKFRKLKSGG